MKAITTNLKKITAMILFLAATTGLTNAQKAFIFNDIPALLAELNSEILSEIILSAEATRTSYDIYYETELELEDWMMDYDILSVADANEEAMPSVFEVETETIELEEWMVQPASPEILIADQEEELELESWMIDQKDWVE
ncbi:MAG: hypothetical protein ISS19_02600 [Bacteroidales bacterium]|nr:hypothetical protein [Bacteroidales bacterium]